MLSTPKLNSSDSSINPSSAYIVGYSRTPFTSYGGKLSTISPIQLGAHAITHALKQAGLAPSNVDEVFFGNVLQAGIGQNPARQAAIAAKIPISVPATTINKVCSSGMKAIMYAAQGIQCGDGDIYVAGGMESMSTVPHYVNGLRFGIKYGHSEMVDGLKYDGLTDPFDDFSMGSAGEVVAAAYNLSRKDQDAYAAESYSRAELAYKTGVFKNEVAPFTVKGRKKNIVVDQDEEYIRFNADRFYTLRPAFPTAQPKNVLPVTKKVSNLDLTSIQGKTVTAGNASPLSDGAAALIIVSGRAILKHQLTPLALIRSYADAAVAPVEFPCAPVFAIKKCINKMAHPVNFSVSHLDPEDDDDETKNIDSTLLSINDIDLFEVNEAFSIAPLAVMKQLQIPHSKMNIHSGAIALGHPLGASGARIVGHLALSLILEKKKFGCAAICNGGGGSSGIIIESCVVSLKQQRPKL